MKALKKLFLFCLAFISLFSFVGCDDGSDGNSQVILPLKVISKPEGEYNYGNIFDTYSKNVLTTIINTYGTRGFANDFIKTGNYSGGVTYQQYYDNFVKESALWNNSILYQKQHCEDSSHIHTEDVLYFSGINNSSWKWNFKSSSNIFNTSSCLTISEIQQAYALMSGANDEYRSKYIGNSSTGYSDALECLMYEIAMGKTPSIFTISYNSLGFATPKKDTLTPTEYLVTLKQEYKNKGSYIGFTSQNVDTLKQYILDNVIGTEIVNDYDIISTQGYTTSEAEIISQLSKNYKKFVNEVLFVVTDDSIPASEISEYETNSVNIIHNGYSISQYEDSDGEYYVDLETDLQNIEAREYQSIIIMPTESKKISSILFAMQSQQNLKINVFARMYNNETKTLTTCDYGKIDVNSNALDLDTIQEYVCKDESGNEIVFDIDTFKNEGNLAAPKNDIGLNPKQITSTNASLFKYLPSKNGFGTITVLNEQAVDFSFYEVCFDVEKTNTDTNTDYTFKVGMFVIVDE